MAAKKGTGLLMVWADVPADKEAEFNRWYNEEHLAERLAIPGFLNGARYEAVKGGPKHLAVYELESPAVLDSATYTLVPSKPRISTRMTMFQPTSRQRMRAKSPCTSVLDRVAHAAHRADQRPRKVAIDFVAQIVDVDLDHV